MYRHIPAGGQLAIKYNGRATELSGLNVQLFDRQPTRPISIRNQHFKKKKVHLPKNLTKSFATMKNTYCPICTDKLISS